MYRPDLTRISESEIDNILEKAASDFGPYEMFLCDDLRWAISYPDSWEDKFITASPKDAADPDYLIACAEVLLRMRSRWEGLPRLLAKTLECEPNPLGVARIMKFASYNEWKLPNELCAITIGKISSMSRLSRFLIRLWPATCRIFHICNSC